MSRPVILEVEFTPTPRCWFEAHVAVWLPYLPGVALGPALLASAFFGPAWLFLSGLAAVYLCRGFFGGLVAAYLTKPEPFRARFDASHVFVAGEGQRLNNTLASVVTIRRLGNTWGVALYDGIKIPLPASLVAEAQVARLRAAVKRAQAGTSAAGASRVPGEARVLATASAPEEHGIPDRELRAASAAALKSWSEFVIEVEAGYPGTWEDYVRDRGRRAEWESVVMRLPSWCGGLAVRWLDAWDERFLAATVGPSPEGMPPAPGWWERRRPAHGGPTPPAS